MSEQWRRRFDDLKDAYALGALDDDERLEFEGYLAAHPELQAEVDDLSFVTDLLALAPPEYEPPPELRRNLLRKIGGAEEDAALPSGAPRRAGLRRLLGPAGLMAAAAVLAVFGLFIWNASLRGENEDLRGELETRQTYELQGSGEAQDVQGEVVELGSGRAILMAEDLPSAPEGKAYETWLIHDGVPEPAGIFHPQNGQTATRIEGSLQGADAVAVTVEPSGGSSMPTSDPLLTASL